MDRDAGPSCFKITEVIVATTKKSTGLHRSHSRPAGRLSDRDLEVFNQRHTRLVALGADLGHVLLALFMMIPGLLSFAHEDLHKTNAALDQ